MTIPLVDLVAQYDNIRDEIDAALRGVLEKGAFVLGPNVAAFESEVAKYLGVKHAIGVASGTDALILSLRALEIGPGDEVIVPAYTFFATAEAVSHVGAIPVFVDINPWTYCMDVAQLEGLITPKTKAIIPVHLYGHPADIDPMLEVARSRGIKVIEDNAQAFGAEYKSRKTGSLGHVGCLSFFPSKNLGGFGDGGMVVTDASEVASRVRKLRTHGWDRKYEPEMIGYNSRLDEIQAAILRVKLRHVDRWNERRCSIAKLYRDGMFRCAVELPSEAPYGKHVYYLFVIRVVNQEAVQRHLRSSAVSCRVYYPQPLHSLAPYKHLGFSPGAFPEAERAARETLAIPLYPEMSEDQIESVVSALKQALPLP